MEKHKEFIGENCQNGILNAKTSGTPRPNVPALRFPEFTEEWKRIRVSDLLDFYSTNSLSWEQLEYDSNEPYNLHYGLIHVGLSTLVDLTKDELPSIKDGNVPKKYELCKEGDVAFADASEDTNEVAKVVEFYNLEDKKVVCGLHTIHGRDNNEQAAKGFLGYCFSSNVFHHQIRRIAQGTKIYSISTKNFSEVFVGLPNKNEQQKIATLLRLMDERITIQNRIIEDLKKLKSAIANKLYSSAKGETYSFRQLFEVVNEKNKKLTYSNVLSASQELGMIERSDINIDIKFEQDSISGYKIVHKGDYVVHLRSFQGGFAFSDRTGICSPAYTILRPNDLVAYGYLSHFFTSKSFIKSLKLVTYGIRDGRSINVDEWLDMTVTLPIKQEQIHVLTIINAIDSKLRNETMIQSDLFRQRLYLLNTMFI